jgi:DDE superfamily endonuclease
MVLQCITSLYVEFTKLPNSDTPVPARIAEPTVTRSGQYYRFWPYFRDCVGALDGSHIKAFISGQNPAPWRNRKGYLSQNVLIACDFDLQIVFCLAGWEGSAHDSRVLDDAILKGFEAPSGKYYLADAGYSNTPITLVPYRGVRYHLREQAAAGLKPQNKEELFNLRHSSLRNAVERALGVIKRRFHILTTAPEYSISTQVNIIYAIIALHNFLQLYGEDFEEVQGDLPEDDSSAQSEDEEEDTVLFELNGASQDNAGMKAFRDTIAQQMWEDYQSHLRQG